MWPSPWDANLSGYLGLNVGWDYTVTFDARGAEGRTMLAGIGDNYEPWISNTETVTVGLTGRPIRSTSAQMLWAGTTTV